MHMPAYLKQSPLLTHIPTRMQSQVWTRAAPRTTPRATAAAPAPVLARAAQATPLVSAF